MLSNREKNLPNSLYVYEILFQPKHFCHYTQHYALAIKGNSQCTYKPNKRELGLARNVNEILSHSEHVMTSQFK